MTEIAEFLKNNPVTVIITTLVALVAGILTILMFFWKTRSPQESPPQQPRFIRCARCNGKGRYGDYPGTSIDKYFPQQTCEVCRGRGVLQV